METQDIVINNNRIVYVDPNNVRGEMQSGVQLTPDYTNFSIWCNLVVERTSRLKNQADGSSLDEIYVASWDMSRKTEGGQVSFFGGKDVELYNFLTTDYTNIDFDEIKKRNIIEGLQIQSVDIAFVNWQTPQITIKFVDIRGGGFFGREEATHNELGHLSNLETDENQNQFDNFFSCFVTYPYPRFRLQIKGFYGKPVTFQLTCTSFTGKFNSSTGNFEIVVQFIGYEYGVLGDIPFDLLVCAPLTKDGAAYWDEHVRNMDKNGWALDKLKTEAPIKLIDFYYNVSNALQAIKNGDDIDYTEDDAVEATLTSLIDQINELNQIQTAIKEFRDLVKKTFDPQYVTEYSDQDEDTIIIYNTEIYSDSVHLEAIDEKYKSLFELVAFYNEKYAPEGNDSDLDIFSNMQSADGIGKRGSVKFGKLMTHTSSGDKSDKYNHSNIIEALDSNDHKNNMPLETESSLSGYKVGGFFGGQSYIISDGMSKRMFENLSSRNWAVYGEDLGNGKSFAGYALAISLGKNIDAKITELNNEYKDYKEKVNTIDAKKIKDILGFTPYVGRYFKVVMCHLETFMELFYQCADQIYNDMHNGLRRPSKLGIRMDLETDVPSSIYNDIPPFPAVYKKYTTDEENDRSLNTGRNIMANTWIGDFSDNWREKEMVDELAKAAKRVNEARQEQVNLTTSSHSKIRNAVFPIDCISTPPQYAYTTIDGAALYAALRAEMQLDFMVNRKLKKLETKDWGYLIGVVDGYSYATNAKNNQFLEELLDMRSLSERLYNSTVYSDEFTKQQAEKYYYEFCKVYQDRHPVFVENGDNATYNYMTNVNTNSVYIPFTDFPTVNGKNGFATDFNYNTGTDFTPKNPETDGFLDGRTDTTASEYSNTPHIRIITDESDVKGLKNSYKTFVKETVNKFDKPDNYKEMADEFTVVSDESVQQYYAYDSQTKLYEAMQSYDTRGVKIDLSSQDKALELISELSKSVY